MKLVDESQYIVQVQSVRPLVIRSNRINIVLVQHRIACNIFTISSCSLSVLLNSKAACSVGWVIFNESNRSLVEPNLSSLICSDGRYEDVPANLTREHVSLVYQGITAWTAYFFIFILTNESIQVSP